MISDFHKFLEISFDPNIWVEQSILTNQNVMHEENNPVIKLEDNSYNSDLSQLKWIDWK